MSENKSNFWDHLGVIVKWRKQLFLLFMTATITAALVNFLVLPKWYEATAVIMPPQNSSNLSGLESILENLPPIFNLGQLGQASPQQVLVTVAKSRTVADAIIDKFNLMELYDEEYRFKAREELEDHTTIDAPPEGHIVISFEAKEDPELAADVANEYITQLNRVLSETAIYSAQRKRMFLEERLAKSKENLTKAEEALREYGEQHNVIEITEQARAALASAAQIEAEIISKDVGLTVLKRFSTALNPDVIRLEAEIKELRDKLNKMMNQGIKTEQSAGDNLFIPFSNVPEVALEYSRLYRDIKLQEGVVSLLTAQYEQAKIQETNDTPVSQILDKALVPEYKHRPKRALNTLLTGFVALFLGILYAFAMEYFSKLKQDEPAYSSFVNSVVAVKEDLHAVRKKILKR